MVRTRTGKASKRDSLEQPILPAFHDEDLEEGSGSDDDAPVEVTSKKPQKNGPDMMLVEDEEPELSLFEQVQEKKQKEEELKAEKKKARKIKRKKTTKGQYVVQTKKTSFNVITLDTGLSQALEPEINFKAELLKARTNDRRVRNAKTVIHRSKWIGKSISM